MEQSHLPNTPFLKSGVSVSDNNMSVYLIKLSWNQNVKYRYTWLHRCMSVFVWENWFEKNYKLTEPLLVSTIRLFYATIVDKYNKK